MRKCPWNALAAPLLFSCAAGCAGLSGPDAFRLEPTAETCSQQWASASAPELLPCGSLSAAGGGRPGTGYVGAAAAILLARSDELSNGWGLDLNYTHNLGESFSVELSLGAAGYRVERPGLSGRLSTVALGAAAQWGRPLGAARWYASAGVGWWLNDLSGLGGAEVGDSFAALLAAGAYLPIWGRGSLALELRYAISTAEVSSAEDLVLDAFSTRVNYVFLY